MWDFSIHSLCQRTEAQNLNAFLWRCEKQGSHAKRNQKRQYVPRFSMKHFCRSLKWMIFPLGSRLQFIQMNRRSASFECWVYHFELNNPLSASIVYSNESMKREIWKLNLKTCKKEALNAVWTIFAMDLKQPLPLCNRTDMVTTVFLTLFF